MRKFLFACFILLSAFSAMAQSPMSNAEIASWRKYRWDALTPGEINQLQNALQTTPPPLVVVIDCGNGQCRDLADGLATVLGSVGWPVISLNAPVASIGIHIIQPNGSPEAQLGTYSVPQMNQTIAATTALAAAFPQRWGAVLTSHSLLSTRITIGIKPQ